MAGKQPIAPPPLVDHDSAVALPTTNSAGGRDLPDARPIEPSSDEVVDEDEFLATGWDATSEAGSTSVSSSVYRHEYEHGRRYHAYKHGRYPIPNDDSEQNREDMKHAMMMELTDGRLFYAPIDEHPQKILDMGTGTGMWAIEVADLYGSAEVLGVDLSPIQPPWLPPNLKFIIDDLEDDWVYGSGWDYVHFRNMAVILRNLQRTIDQVFVHMKPGGWIEFQETDGDAHCDDGTMAEDDTMKVYYQTCVGAMGRFGFDIGKGVTVREDLEKAGFVNINCIVKKVPLGPWPRDRILRLVGQYAKLAALEGVRLTVLGKPFAAAGYGEMEREIWAAKIRQALNDESVHRYYNYYFWFAQKPE